MQKQSFKKNYFMNTLVSHFKLKPTQRIKAEEPKDLNTWIKHGLSEFMGTIVLSMFLAGLSMVIKVKNRYVTLEVFLIHPVLVGFYAGFIAVGTVLVIFLRWSCDLNPAVTLVRVFKAANTYRYGFYKVMLQFSAGILTGLMIVGFGSLAHDMNQNGYQVFNHAIDATKSANTLLINQIGYKPGVVSGALIIFFGEIVMTSILLFSIFSPRISDKYRDLMICLIISTTPWMGILQGSAAINPARGLAQQVPGLFWGYQAGSAISSHSLLAASIANLFGGLVAPLAYIMFQGLGDKTNDLLRRMIHYRNFRSENMRIDSQVNKNFKPKNKN